MKPKQIFSKKEFSADGFEFQPPPIDKIMEDFYEQAWEHFKKALRAFAEPPIKGEITKGKLKWRGIYVVNQSGVMLSDDYIVRCWLEQRGKQISNIIEMPTFTIPEMPET